VEVAFKQLDFFRAAFIGTSKCDYNKKNFNRFRAKSQELDVVIMLHPEHRGSVTCSECISEWYFSPRAMLEPIFL